MNIGKRIAELRKKHGLTQEYLAETLGVSRQAVSKWENDQTSPDTANLIALAEILDTSVEYLAMGKNPKAREKPAELFPETENRHGSFGVRKAVGLILLGAGLLSLILGILFAEILVLLSVFLIVAGCLCLTLWRHPALVLSWSLLLTALLIACCTVSVNPFSIFTAAFYTGGGLTQRHLFVIAFWVCVAVLTVLTVAILVRSIKNSPNE